jgi:hypothetical protein
MVLEYKVLSQSDSFWKDRFSAAALEARLNELARAGWRVVTVMATEFTGLGGVGTKRHELLAVLERETSVAVASEMQTFSAPENYAVERIPADRWYSGEGQVASRLQGVGIAPADIDLARRCMAERGGHLLDHVLALGLIDEKELRRLFGRPPIG